MSDRSSYSNDSIKKAKKRAAVKNQWRKEAVVWLSVSTLLIMINAFSGGQPWFQWAVIPWAIVLMMRRLLMWSAGRDAKVEAREIKRELKRRGLADDYGQDYYEDEEDIEDLELDEIPPNESEVVRPSRRWDDRDFV